MVTTDVLATFLMAAAAQRCKRRRVVQELVSQHLKPGAGSLLQQVGHRRFGDSPCAVQFILRMSEEKPAQALAVCCMRGGQLEELPRIQVHFSRLASW